MSLIKLISIIAIAGLAIFALLLWYTLSPTVRNVKPEPPFGQWLGKDLFLTKTACIRQREKGQYDLEEYELSDKENYPGTITQTLSPGTPIRLQTFKTYVSGTAGFTHLYALGTYTAPGKQPLHFEYDLGYLNGPVDQLGHLPPLPWTSKP